MVPGNWGPTFQFRPLHTYVLKISRALESIDSTPMFWDVRTCRSVVRFEQSMPLRVLAFFLDFEKKKKLRRGQSSFYKKKRTKRISKQKSRRRQWGREPIGAFFKFELQNWGVGRFLCKHRGVVGTTGPQPVAPTTPRCLQKKRPIYYLISGASIKMSHVVQDAKVSKCPSSK